MCPQSQEEGHVATVNVYSEGSVSVGSCDLDHPLPVIVERSHEAGSITELQSTLIKATLPARLHQGQLSATAIISPIQNLEELRYEQRLVSLSLPTLAERRQQTGPITDFKNFPGRRKS